MPRISHENLRKRAAAQCPKLSAEFHARELLYIKPTNWFLWKFLILHRLLPDYLTVLYGGILVLGVGGLSLEGVNKAEAHEVSEFRGL